MDVSGNFYSQPNTKLFYALSAVLVILLCLILATAKNHSTSSDPRGTLLVSEALIQHGTIKVDAYGVDLLSRYGYVFYEKNDHFYYYFPIGTSIISAPFVAVINAFGIDVGAHEPIVQMAFVLAAELTLFVLLLMTARLFLSPLESVLLAGLCWFGSAFASTLGTALWSHDFAVVFGSGAIYLVLKDVLQSKRSNFFAIALCLFLAYLCRPTLSLLSPFLLLYYFIYRRVDAIKAAFVLMFLLAGFIGWSYYEFSQPLPDYYLPQRIDGSNMILAVYGNILSPARGLYVFSPFLLLSLLLSFFFSFKIRDFRNALLITLAWPLAHLFTVSRFPHWWAGYCFGPRLMVDVLPGLFVGLFFSFKLLGPARRWAYLILLVAGAFSIYINTFQGLYNTYVERWNEKPSVDQYPQYLFDWHYPQFAYGPARDEKRQSEFETKQPSFFQPKWQIKTDSPGARYDGFYPPETSLRWTSQKHAAITFNLIDTQNFIGEMQLLADFLSSERLGISINGQPVLQRSYFGGGLEIRFGFDPRLLREGENTIEFYLPDAHRPPPPDMRFLGMALHQLSLR